MTRGCCGGKDIVAALIFDLNTAAGLGRRQVADAGLAGRCTDYCNMHGTGGVRRPLPKGGRDEG